MQKAKELIEATSLRVKRCGASQMPLAHKRRRITCIAQAVGNGLLVRGQANVSRHKTWTADRVEKLWKELDGQIETAMAELETNDSIGELFDDGTSLDKLPPQLADLTSRRTMLHKVLMPIAFTVRQAKRCLAQARRLVKQRVAWCCMSSTSAMNAPAATWPLSVEKLRTRRTVAR